MKSYHANSGSGLGGLVLKEHREPRPGTREVLLRVRANSLNARELSVLQGTYPLPVTAVATIRVIFAGNRTRFADMNRAITVNRLRPLIDRVFPFDAVVSAFRYFETGQAFGKVVISQC